MWLGEQIQEEDWERISLIITAGIISWLLLRFRMGSLLSQTVGVRQLQPLTLLIMVFFLVAVVISITLITQGDDSVQYARRIVGRKVYGGRALISVKG